jgi:ADP-ribose pyrophosphatase
VHGCSRRRLRALTDVALVITPPRIRPWRLSDRKEVAHYNVFGVVSEQLSDSEGVFKKTIYTLACGSWCNVVAITNDDELVLVWQWRFGSREMSLEIPGGVVDTGEEPIVAARRELLEETGYACTSIEPLITTYANPPLHGNRLHSFLAKGAHKVAEPSFDHAEECEVALIPAKYTEALLDEGHVQHALCHPALGAYARRFIRGACR